MAVAVIAIVADLTLGGLRLAAAADSTATLGRVAQLAVLGQRVTVLAEALEDERDLMAGFIAVGRPPPGNVIVGNAESRTNQAADRVTDAAGSLGTGLPATTQAKVATVLTRIADLAGVRQAAVYTQLPSVPVIMDYEGVIDDLFSLNDEIAEGSADPAVADSVRALGDLSRLEDAASMQRALLFAALNEHYFEPRALASLIDAQSAEAGYLQAFAATATPALQQAYNNEVAGSQVDQAQLIEQRVIATGIPQTDGLGLPAGNPASQWYAGMTETLTPIRAVEAQLAGSIIDQSRALQAGPQRSELLTIGFTAAFLIFVLAVTLLVARSIVLPLRRLKSAVLEIAADSLPARVTALAQGGDAVANLHVRPISAYSADEIGQVASAVDQVHAQAVRLAGGQAIARRQVGALLVGLSDRSQSSLDQLAGILPALVGPRPDSARQADLAAADRSLERMRRQCRLLLALADHEAARQQDNGPVSLIKIAVAAVSGIDLGHRLSVDIPPGLGVAGYAAADIAALLAELVENAANFSSGTAPVTLCASEPPDGGLHIEISDGGPGVTLDRLDELNARLADPARSGADGSRQLGLFVVAYLAARHGAQVRLEPVTAGTVAQVWLPAAITIGRRPDSVGQPRWQLSTGAQPVPSGRSGAAAAPSAGPSAVTPPDDRAAALPVRDPRGRRAGRHAAPQALDEP